MSAPMPPAGSDLDLRLARPWPDGVPENATTPNSQGLCACCMRPFGGDRIWHNGSFAHHRCAAEHERLILGDDAMPGLLEYIDALDAHAAFLRRLAAAADHHGIDRAALANAVEEACR